MKITKISSVSFLGSHKKHVTHKLFSAQCYGSSFQNYQFLNNLYLLVIGSFEKVEMLKQEKKIYQQCKNLSISKDQLVIPAMFL